MRSMLGTARRLLPCLALACLSAGAQQQDSGPSAGNITVTGISSERFNPTHGTVFLELSGAYFSADPRDLAIFVNESQLPVSDVLVTRRIVAASYVMEPGVNTLSFRAWDAAGKTLSGEIRVWAGDLDISAQLIDSLNQPLEGGSVIATLADEPGVSATVIAADGSALIPNLPDARVILEARHPSGLSATMTVPALQRRATLVVR
ncbi:MAG: carboxypeptidase regulatory-like domain-containing protein [Gammaproteobacteria bacterium]|nr:MAG: carboxypeptidase regulatory-like domain-containing protein [Gammaproteobacteria bacterium]